MAKMFSPGSDGNSGFGSIMSKIISKVGTKLNDGTIDQKKMTDEASNIMKSLGGSNLFGANNPLTSMFNTDNKE